MDYEAHYNRLILRARDRTLTGYVERHHVLPRCMGGGDEPGNIVALTAEEHYVAHQLLVKMNPGNHKVACAAVFMSIQSGGNKPYGWLKRRKADARRGAKHRPETIAKMSAAQRGHKRGIGMRRSDAMKMKMSLAMMGKSPSPETRAKISATLTGRKMGPRSPEAIAKTAAAHRGRKHSEEHRRKLSIAHMGQRAWNKGLRVSIGIASPKRKGKPLTEERKATISAFHKGRPKPAQHGAKVASAQRLMYARAMESRMQK